MRPRLLAEAVPRYLARHAKVVDRHLHRGRRQGLGAVLPVRLESVDAVTGALDALPPQSVLFAVVNGRRGDPPEVEETHRSLLRALGARGPLDAIPVRDRLLVVLDRATDAKLGAREGVGTARRLGLDLALLWHHEGAIASPWLFSTDADARLPRDGFEVEDAGWARSYPIWHEASGQVEIDRATALYELWLRYYALGLSWSGSGYAMLTVGSALAVRANGYATVGGMPRRAGGEDFYLLNKVAKLAAVVSPATAPVRIASRRSDRVPFGTGPAVERILADADSLFLAPSCFARLRSTLSALSAWSPPAPLTLEPTASAALELIGGERALRRAITGAPHADGRRQRLHEWFDALRTLRFLHAVRDIDAPSMPWPEALARAPFVPPLAPEDLADPLLVEARRALERALPRTAGRAASVLA